MSCEKELLQGYAGTCVDDVPGFDKVWCFNRTHVENIVLGSDNIVTSFALTTGKHAFSVPFEKESIKPDYSLVVNDIGKNRYKHSIEINTVARTAADLKALRASDLVFVFKLKQPVTGAGRFVMYGFGCGLVPSSETSALIKSGAVLKLESYKDQTEMYQYHIVFNTSDTATEQMLNGFLAS